MKKTSDVIWDEPQGVGHLKAPGTEGEWKSIAFDSREKRNFYNCLGAIDGKNVVM